MSDNSKTTLPYRLVPLMPPSFVVGTSPGANRVEYAKTHAEALRLQKLLQEAEIAQRRADDARHGFNFRIESVEKVRVFQRPYVDWCEVVPVESAE